MPGAPGATLGTEGCDSLQGDAELCPRAVNTCSACDAPSTMEALPREENGNSVPPRHWLASSGLEENPMYS